VGSNGSRDSEIRAVSASGRIDHFRGVEVDVRDAEEREITHLARLWYEGWQDAHAKIVPDELRRLRTLESFMQRLEATLSNTRVVGPRGAPSGFYILKDNELYQMYVAPHARGSDVAHALIADAESRLARNGFENAWLACAIGNDRAARFYEKAGWRRVGVVTYQAETSTGIFPLQVWRYEKRLDAT
jgi:GNAT superfamily N-acetyltransferase